MAYRPIGLCGMGKERTKGKGLEGGHTLQAKEMTHLVAPFRARYYCPDGPQATQTSGLCTLGFVQFKAAGLVQAFDLLGAINNFTACPNAENRSGDTPGTAFFCAVDWIVDRKMGFSVGMFLIFY